MGTEMANDMLLPVLAQVLLTVAMYFVLAVAKSRAVKAGRVDLGRRALHDDAWPESVMKINNNIRNQFELPVLFYVLALMLWQLGDVDRLTLALAWLFVASRIVHAWIHTRSNYVPARRRVFTFGVMMVLAMAAVALRQLH
jgi:hypothetical protein